MDELQIATSMAHILDSLENSPNYSASEKGVQDYKEELMRLDIMTKKLAMSHARKLDFRIVLMDTEHMISIQLAWIFETTMDPVLKGLTAVVVEEEVGNGQLGICAVCQDEIESVEDATALGCKHVFHRFCIWKWLKYQKKQCPLCRFQI